jgi:hypothetical protein
MGVGSLFMVEWFKWLQKYIKQKQFNLLTVLK